MTIIAKLLVFLSMLMGGLVAVLAESPLILRFGSSSVSWTGAAPSRVQIFVMMMTAAGCLHTAIRATRPNVLAALPWIVTAATWFIPLLPGVHSPYPPTRFLMILSLAIFWAESRQWTPRRIGVGTVLLALLWIALDFGRSYLLYRKLEYGYDLAHVLNLLENTARGRFLYSDYTGASILSHHLFLTLSLLAPLYTVFHEPFLPQIIQIAAMGISVFVIGSAARARYGDGPGIAAMLFLLVHPAFQGQILHEMDPAAIGMLGTSVAIWGFVQDDLRALSIGVVFAILSKEHFAAAGVVAGFLLICAPARRVEGVLLAVVSALALAGFILYSLSLDAEFGLAGQAALRFQSGSGGVAEILKSALAPPRLGYLLHLLAPSGFLCLLSPLWILPASPEILIVLTSKFPMYKLSSHYAALSLPFLSMAAAGGMARLSMVAGYSRQTVAAFGVASAIVAAIFSQLGPLSHTCAFYDVFFEAPTRDADELRDLVARIPGGTVGVLGDYRALILIPEREPVMPLGYIDTSKRLADRDYLILDRYDGKPPPGYKRIDGNANTELYRKNR